MRDTHPMAKKAIQKQKHNWVKKKKQEGTTGRRGVMVKKARKKGPGTRGRKVWQAGGPVVFFCKKRGGLGPQEGESIPWGGEKGTSERGEGHFVIRSEKGFVKGGRTNGKGACPSLEERKKKNYREKEKGGVSKRPGQSWKKKKVR